MARQESRGMVEPEMNEINLPVESEIALPDVKLTAAERKNLTGIDRVGRPVRVGHSRYQTAGFDGGVYWATSQQILSRLILRGLIAAPNESLVSRFVTGYGKSVLHGLPFKLSGPELEALRSLNPNEHSVCDPGAYNQVEMAHQYKSLYIKGVVDANLDVLDDPDRPPVYYVKEVYQKIFDALNVESK